MTATDRSASTPTPSPSTDWPGSWRNGRLNVSVCHLSGWVWPEYAPPTTRTVEMVKELKEYCEGEEDGMGDSEET